MPVVPVKAVSFNLHHCPASDGATHLLPICSHVHWVWSASLLARWSAAPSQLLYMLVFVAWRLNTEGSTTLGVGRLVNCCAASAWLCCRCCGYQSTSKHVVLTQLPCMQRPLQWQQQTYQVCWGAGLDECSHTAAMLLPQMHAGLKPSVKICLGAMPYEVKRESLNEARDLQAGASLK